METKHPFGSTRRVGDFHKSAVQPIRIYGGIFFKQEQAEELLGRLRKSVFDDSLSVRCLSTEENDIIGWVVTPALPGVFPKDWVG